MKLQDSIRAGVDAADHDPLLLGALEAISRGYRIFPIRRFTVTNQNGMRITKCTCAEPKCENAGKHPAIKWKDDATANPAKVVEWWGVGGRFRGCGIGAALDEHDVIDIDPKHPEVRLEMWEDRLDTTVGVVTGVAPDGRRGLHLHYQHTEERTLPQKANNLEGWPGIDTRVASKGYVVLPPSPHPSGVEYEWTGTTVPQALPEPLWTEILARAAGKARTSPKGHGATRTTGGRTTLAAVADLQAPTGDGDGRNDRLTSILGHVLSGNAGQFEDGFRALAHWLNRGMDAPLDEAEVDKTVDSLWTGHEDRHGGEPGEANGWLQSRKGVLTTQAKGKGEEPDYMAPWGNFDLRPLGRMRDEEDRITYLVRLTMRATGEVAEVSLPASLLGDDRALKKMLSTYGANWNAVNGDKGQTATPGSRLLRFIEAAKPESIQIVPNLGWSEKAVGFVTYDGIIDRHGPRQTKDGRRIVADPALAAGGHARYHYGFERDAAEAVRVLQFVMTTHTQEVAATLGAWWAGTFLKARVLGARMTSLWPILAVEGPSGTAKTGGTGGLLVEMSGSLMGATKPTQAALRNMMAGNNAGIVWWDDPNRLDELAHELMRLSTAQESLSKMGPDNMTVLEFPLRSALMLSGEGLGLDKQLADIDRTVQVAMTSPQGRMSQIKGRGDRPQWDDIVELRSRYTGAHGMSSLAGWYVQMALAGYDQFVLALSALRVGAGRASEKAALMAASARLLDAMMAGVGTEAVDADAVEAAWRGEGWAAQHVSLWQTSSDVEYTRSDWLVNEMLPTLWALEGFPDSPIRGAMDNRRTAIPVFLDGDDVWFNPAAVAEAWRNRNHGRTQDRIESREAIINQAQAAGLGGQMGVDRKQWRTDTTHSSTGQKVMYWRVRGPLAAQIVAASTGIQRPVDAQSELWSDDHDE